MPVLAAMSSAYEVLGVALPGCIACWAKGFDPEQSVGVIASVNCALTAERERRDSWTAKSTRLTERAQAVARAQKAPENAKLVELMTRALRLQDVLQGAFGVEAPAAECRDCCRPSSLGDIVQALLDVAEVLEDARWVQGTMKELTEEDCAMLDVRLDRLRVLVPARLPMPRRECNR